MVDIFFNLPLCKFFLVVNLVSLKNVNPTSTCNLKMFIYFIGKSLDGQLEMLLRRLEGECFELNRKEISPNYIVFFKHLYTVISSDNAFVVPSISVYRFGKFGWEVF